VLGWVRSLSPGFRSLLPAFGSRFLPRMTKPCRRPGQPYGSAQHNLPLKFSPALTVRRGFYLFKLIFLRLVFCHGSREEREADEVRTSSFFILPSSLGDGVSLVFIRGSTLERGIDTFRAPKDHGNRGREGCICCDCRPKRRRSGGPRRVVSGWLTLEYARRPPDKALRRDHCCKYL